MFSTTLVLFVLAAQPTGVAIPRFQVSHAQLALGRLCEDTLATDLAHQGADVLREPAAARTPLEKSFQDCGRDIAACAPGLSGQLGVGYLLRGVLADDAVGHHLTVSLLDGSGHPVLARTLDDPNDLSLIDQVHRLAGELALELERRSGGPLDAHASRRRYVPWLIGGGGVAVLGGLVLCGLAARDAGQVAERHDDVLPADEALSTARAGTVKQDFGVGLLIAGGLATGAGLFMLFTSRTHEPRILIGAAPVANGGAGLVLAGRLP